MGVTASLASSAFLLERGVAASPSSARTRPRHVVLIFLRGGIDSIYTTDPKTARDVAKGIDVPYPPSAIVESGSLRLGPHLAPLAPFATDMAIVNGVQLHTANHQTGGEQFVRLRTSVSATMPSILDIAAHRRDGQPLGCVTIGDLVTEDHTPGWFGDLSVSTGRPPLEALFSQIDRLESGELELLATTLRDQARDIRAGSPPDALETTAENIEQVASLFERLKNVKPFQPEVWSPIPTTQSQAVALQRILWLLENDLTKSAFLQVREWDTHTFNESRQKHASSVFFPLFARFLAASKLRATQFGTVFDNTLFVLGSEIGRFPRLNGDGGKDHFPEAPFLFIGKSINTGGQGAAFGGTGREMESLSVRWSDGRPTGADGPRIQLDDIGASLLHIVGVQPRRYGYGGRVLDFLV